MFKVKLACAAAVFAIIGCSAAASPSATAVLEAPVASAQVVLATPAAAPEAPTLTPVQYLAPEADCDVRVRRTANGARIEARVHSDFALDGEYSFDLDVSGGGGSSVISQGGEVLLDAGDSALVAQNEVSLNRGSRLRAEFVVHDEAGEVCRRIVRL